MVSFNVKVTRPPGATGREFEAQGSMSVMSGGPIIVGRSYRLEIESGKTIPIRVIERQSVDDPDDPDLPRLFRYSFVSP